MLHGLRERLTAVTGGFPAAHRGSSALHLNAAATAEAVVKAYYTLLECHGKSDYLKSRAGLVGVRQCLVAPLQTLCIGEKLIFLFFSGGFVYHAFRLVADIKEIVEIIPAKGCHGKYLAGVDIHYNRTRAVFYIIILDGLIERFFNIVLYAHVDGRHDIAAVFGSVISLILVKQKVGSVCVSRTHILAVRTAQGGVILGLNAVKSDVIRADKANHMTGKRRVRIIALCVAFKAHALEIVIFFELPHLVGKLGFELFCNGHIPRAGVLRFFKDGIIVKIQYLGKVFCDKLWVLAIHFYLRRTEIHILDICAHRQNILISVVYRASGGGSTRLTELLADSKILIFLVISYLEYIQSCGKRQKCKYAAHCHQEKCAAEHRSVRTAAKIIGFLRFLHDCSFAPWFVYHQVYWRIKFLCLS